MKGILSLQRFSGISYTSQSDWLFIGGLGGRVNLCQARPLSCLLLVTWQASVNTREQRGEATHWDETGLWKDIFLPRLHVHACISVVTFAFANHLSMSCVRFQPLLKYIWEIRDLIHLYLHQFPFLISYFLPFLPVFCLHQGEVIVWFVAKLSQEPKLETKLGTTLCTTLCTLSYTALYVDPQWRFKITQLTTNQKTIPAY